MGFAEASKERRESEQGVFWVTDIGWALGVTGSRLGPSARSFPQQDDVCRGYSLRTKMSQQMFCWARLFCCFVLFCFFFVCVCACAIEVTLTNLDIMHVVYFQLLLKSQELGPHSPGQ